MAGLLQLGKFKFQPTGPSMDAFEEAYAYKWEEQEMVSTRPQLYWGEKKSQTMQITGAVYSDLITPQLTNGLTALATSSFAALASIQNSFKELDAMASAGKSYPLVDVTGKFYGDFVIEDFTVSNSVIWFDGVPRKKTFSLKLKKDLQSTPDENRGTKYSDQIDLTIIKIRDIING